MNPGNHFDPDKGSYKVPYSGLYHFTVVMQAYDDSDIHIRLVVDGKNVAYAGNPDYTKNQNTVVLTRNLHLSAGQVVSVDTHQMSSVYGSSYSMLGYESWFSGDLIYPDTLP